MTRADQPTYLTAVVAGPNGDIFELDGYAATGMAGPDRIPLTLDKTVSLPHGSELMLLPDRYPVLYNLEQGEFEAVFENPYVPGEPVTAVAAFNSPGYVVTRISSYAERDGAGLLPLFSYGAVGWHGGGFRSAVLRVDRERRQDLRLMPREKVVAGVKRMRQRLPGNRLREHLETCALRYGCPAGKNFFLQRYEAPLPTATTCNARCLGCLSLQKESPISCSQERIAFTPSPEEIADVALAHIRKVAKGVVSFGQGCEGDPLLAADVIATAIRRIRAATDRGTVNMNTNGSRPDLLENCLRAGLDSIRISLNSVRKEGYEAYFRPRGYGFPDVLRSIDTAVSMGKFVSINLLNLPGVTDTPEEADALIAFVARHGIDMIQWRNLNYDPIRYGTVMDRAAPLGTPIGVDTLLSQIREAFPQLRFGYFNPPKEDFAGAGGVPGGRASKRSGRDLP